MYNLLKSLSDMAVLGNYEETSQANYHSLILLIGSSPDVVFKTACDIFGYFIRNTKAKKLGLAFNDSKPRLKVGRLDIGDETPFKTGAKPVFKGLNLFGGAVRCQHDLFF